jgi:hypothetical protein
MRGIIKAFFLLIIIILGTNSCNKEPSYRELFYNSLLANSDGKEKKVDVKGSLMNGDMKSPNIESWLIDNILYVCFYETVENCMTLVTDNNGNLLFSRRMDKQYPCVVRVFMGNEPTGTYHLYITDGIKTAEGDFYYVNASPWGNGKQNNHQ